MAAIPIGETFGIACPEEQSAYSLYRHRPAPQTRPRSFAWPPPLEPRARPCGCIARAEATGKGDGRITDAQNGADRLAGGRRAMGCVAHRQAGDRADRKSTRLNSSH